MKNKLTTKMLALAAAMLLPAMLPAQEVIRISQNQKSNYSLARPWYLYKKWVVYNERADSFSFAVLDTSGTNISACQTQQPFYIKDMEMSDDTLFFCGSMYDSSTMSEVGIMGYFDVTAMPSPSVYYIKFDNLKTLNKLVWYVNYSTKHVVMIGTEEDGRDCIVDAYYNFGPNAIHPGGWFLDKIYISDVKAKFDDIAVTADDVVLSYKVPELSKAYLCFVEKTPIVNMPFYSGSNIRVKTLLDNPSGQILLQNGFYDTVFAVYRNSNLLSICQFQNANNIFSKQIAMPIAFIGGTFMVDGGTLLDVSTDKYAKNLNILLSMSGITSTHHRIYHIPTVKMATGGSINDHGFNDSYDPKSLCRTVADKTVTMGQFTVTWTLSQMANDIAGNCTPLYSATLGEKKLISNSSTKVYFEDYLIGGTSDIMPVASMNSSLIILCQ